LAEQLTTGYGIPRRHATRLVTSHWVLPVLDGLDEMDPAGDTARPRAAAVVQALNVHGTRPVVLVCRRDQYVTLAASATDEAGTASVVQDAHQIILEDLSVEQIVRYLAYRFPHAGERGSVQPRWRPVVAALTSRESSTSAATLTTETSTTLAAALGQPWRLYLAVTAYHANTTDPAQLTRIPPEELPVI
jgi:hypothetical protein